MTPPSVMDIVATVTAMMATGAERRDAVLAAVVAMA